LNQEIINNLFNFLPEIILFTAILTLNFISFLRKDSSAVKYSVFIGGITLSAFFSLIQSSLHPQLVFGGLIVIDPFAYFGKVLISISVLLISFLFFNRTSTGTEYTKILLFQASAMLAVSSVNFVMLLVSVEVMSIALFLLLAGRITLIIKYYIYSAVTTCVMLYGFTLLYGITGYTGYYEMSSSLSSVPFNPLTLSISVIMILAGLFFKMLLPPFNFSFPLLAKNIKIRHLALFVIPVIISGTLTITRFTLTVFHDSNTFESVSEGYPLLADVNWIYVVSAVAGLSVITGHLVILWQYNLKKIVAFITVAQAGYLLLGLVSASPEGTTAMLYNIITAGSVISGLLYSVFLIEKNYGQTAINELKGLGKSDPFLFIMFLLFMLLAAGLPLSAAFSGKVMLFEAIASQGRIVLIAIAVLSSAGFYYFIFRSFLLFFRDSARLNYCKTETFHKTILLILLLPAILPGIMMSSLGNWLKFCTEIFGI
jgi:NADH-quinone oxidoreductase subunit N